MLSVVYRPRQIDFRVRSKPSYELSSAKMDSRFLDKCSFLWRWFAPYSPSRSVG